MATALGSAPDLDLQAEAIERVLLGLSLPVRVNAGEIDGEWVRYQVVPVLGTLPERVCRAGPAVAERIGVAEVRIAPAGRTLALDVPRSRDEGLRLMPLLQTLGLLPAWTAVVGMDEGGAPLLIQMSSPTTDAVVAIGPAGSGKSELLRTLALSLALTTPASEMQVLGIDIGGRELGVLESLPHMGAALATTPRQAGALVSRLEAEVSGRVGEIGETARLLVIDDDRWLSSGEAGCLPLLRRLFEVGPTAGIHLLAATRDMRPDWLSRRPGLIVAQALHSSRTSGRSRAGHFVLRSHRDVTSVRAGYLPASDLNEACRLVHSGWVPGEPLPRDEGWRLEGNPSAWGTGWAA